MTAVPSDAAGFMFPAKGVSHPHINMGGGGKVGNPFLQATFTTGKPHVSRVPTWCAFGKVGRWEGVQHRMNVRMMGKGALR